MKLAPPAVPTAGASVPGPPKHLGEAFERMEAGQRSGRIDVFDAAPAAELDLARRRRTESMETRARRFELTKWVGSSDGPIGDAEARAAVENLSTVGSRFRELYGRDSWDGQGGDAQVVVRRAGEVARWMGFGTVALGQARPGEFDSPARALDVLAHEYTHAVMGHALKDAPERDEAAPRVGSSTAVEESWADVLAATIDSDDWSIAEELNDTVGVRRNLDRPALQHVDQLTERVDPYDESGVASFAAVQVAGAIGREAMGRIWYAALEHLPRLPDFGDAAKATLTAARALHGADTPEYAAVSDAWAGVGVIPR